MAAAVGWYWLIVGQVVGWVSSTPSIEWLWVAEFHWGGLTNWTSVVLDKCDSALFWPISNPTVQNEVTFARKTIRTHKRPWVRFAKGSQDVMNCNVPLRV
jgi:hypothetical protein